MGVDREKEIKSTQNIITLISWTLSILIILYAQFRTHISPIQLLKLIIQTQHYAFRLWTFVRCDVHHTLWLSIKLINYYRFCSDIYVWLIVNSTRHKSQIGKKSRTKEWYMYMAWISLVFLVRMTRHHFYLSSNINEFHLKSHSKYHKFIYEFGPPPYSTFHARRHSHVHTQTHMRYIQLKITWNNNRK